MKEVRIRMIRCFLIILRVYNPSRTDMIKKILLSLFGAIILVIGILYINLKIYMKKGTVVTTGVPIESYQSHNSALLVIDIQEYTTGDISLNEVYKKASDGLIRTINELIEKSAETGIPVIYIRNEVSNPLVNLINNSMAPGNPGAQLDRRLNIASNHILPKEKQDAFSNPQLDSILIANEISRLIIVGLDAAYCVNSTIEGARNRGYDIAVIRDAIVSDPDTMRNHMLNEFGNRDMEILDSKEFILGLENGKL
jgi:nicotinamidase-related amidase